MPPLPQTRRAAALAVILSSVFPLAPALADGATGPTLGAASNLSQGRQENVINLARKLGITDFRDGMPWPRVEQTLDQYHFTEQRTGYPRELAAKDATASVVLNWGNPLYDNGDTPHSDLAVSAFGFFAAAIVREFPAVDSLEIGNEFNGTNFVRGPIKEMTPTDRAKAYVPMLKAAATAARREGRDIRISGGATHSIPVGYLWTILNEGGADYMDSLAIHPYTTPAEQFVRQIDVLRRHPDARDLPIEITEFGEPDPAKAAGHFLRNYCQFALGGVSRAIWYPMNARGDNMVPLFTPGGKITTAGQAYTLIMERMEGQPVTDAAPDAFSYGCAFSDKVLVLWGAERPVEVAEGVEVLDAMGTPVDGPYRLGPQDPLVFVADADITDKVTPGPTRVIADSYHQFAYPEDDEAMAEGDGFARFARRDGKEIPLLTLPGQEAPGTPWYPYRGNPNFGNIRLTAETLLPGGRGDSPVEIVHRYTAETDRTVDLTARFKAANRSKDGITVAVTLNGETLFDQAGKDAIRIGLKALELKAGDVLDIAVGPNQTRAGDVTNYRITLSEG